MTEATPPPEKKERTQPRDAAFWAMKVERLEVSDVPEGAANVNVQGRREVGALQGFGRLWQKTYRLRLTGVEVTPEEAVKVWKERFPEFQPPNSRFYPSMAGVAPGEVLFITASVGGLPVHTGVRVIYADDESFTVMTPEGHPESGWNTFSAYTDEDGTTVAQVQSLARANDPIYELMMPLGLHKMEDRTWQHTLRSLAAYFGASGEVRTRVVCVDPRRQWRNYGNVRYNAVIWSMFHAITAPPRYIKRSVTRGRRGGGSFG